MGYIEKAFILICIYMIVSFGIWGICKIEQHGNNKKAYNKEEELKRMGLK